MRRLLVVPATLAALGAGAAAHEAPPQITPPAGHERGAFAAPVPGSYALPPIAPAADGAVLDGAGRPQRLFELIEGRVAIVSFIYSTCAQDEGCPLATATLYDVFDEASRDPALVASLALVSVSFDPARDTPAVMAEYGAAAAARPAPKPPWHFLTTSGEAALRPLLAGYGQWVGESRDGVFAHVLRLYLVDREKRVRNIYGVGFVAPELLLADIRTLLLENR